MEEILYEIRQHAAALNVGRWDKIFSDIKVLKNHPDRVSADRAKITMLCPWMENYAKRLVKICHEHGAMAIGGMSAFTPGKEAELRQVQTQKVIADKTREFDWGHDGCWVSHPYFITHAMGAFTRNNQLDKLLSEFPRCPDLLMPGSKDQSLSGLRTNIRVGIAYMQGWNKGLGCVAWDDLMEDLATLEISRAQTWQWLHHGVTLQEGKKVDSLLVRQIFTEELQDILHQVKPTVAPHEWPKLEIEFIKAKDAAQELFLKKELPDFLTFASPEASSKEMV
jgi:malate synthase